MDGNSMLPAVALQRDRKSKLEKRSFSYRNKFVVMVDEAISNVSRYSGASPKEVNEQTRMIAKGLSVLAETMGNRKLRLRHQFMFARLAGVVLIPPISFPKF
jgi:hypothetical protein